MSEPERTNFSTTPGQKINLINKLAKPAKYRIDYGEFGSITIDALPGSTIELEAGTQPPVINIFESDLPEGIKILSD